MRIDLPLFCKKGQGTLVSQNYQIIVFARLYTSEMVIPHWLPNVSFQGLSLVLSSYNGEDILVSFGGYNGRYNNEVKNNYVFFFRLYVLKFISFFILTLVATV